MNSVESNTRTSVVAPMLKRFWSHGLIAAGLILSPFDSHFFILAGLGFFGPGILSELGILRLDEFQQETRWRASHQAFLISGLVLALVVGFEGCGQQYNDEMHTIDDAVPASLVLTVMLAVYFLSSLYRYWGNRVAAFRTLVVYASLTVVIYVTGMIKAVSMFDRFPVAWALEFAAFIGLQYWAAFTGRHRPRLAAGMTLGAIAWLLARAGAIRFFADNGMPWEVSMDVLLLLVLPPVAAMVGFFQGDRA